MKKILLLFVCLPVTLLANPALKNLMIVNSQWVNNADGVALAQGLNKLPNEDIIISHLMLVEQVLRSRPTHDLSENQMQNRIKYLNILNGYWKNGIVPTNDYAPGRFPIFIDRKGVHCAVGYLLQQGGFEHIARKINEKHQFDYIHQIGVSELKEWQMESGLSIDELAWIQPGYEYPGTALSLGVGLKGNVKDIKESSGKYQLVAGGHFTIDNDSSFILLAGWDGVKWNPIISGIGIINKIQINGHIITSYGGEMTFDNFVNVEIIETDISKDVVVHKLIGDFNGEISDFEIYKDQTYVCGKFTGGLAVWENNSWAIKSSPTFTNPNSIRTYNGKLYLTGFQISHSTYNLVWYDGTVFRDAGLLPKQPNFLQVFSNMLFVGLKSDQYTDSLLYYFDGVKLTIFDSIQYFFGREVRSIVTYKNKMLLTGDLGQQTGWGIYYSGHGVVIYDAENPNKINPIIDLNGTVNAAIYNGDNRIIVAGDFTHYTKYIGNSGYGPYTPLNGCAIVYENRSLISIKAAEVKISQLPYPNPMTNLVTFPANGRLIDMTGKQVLDIVEGVNDLSNLSQGVFIFSSTSGNFRITKQ